MCEICGCGEKPRVSIDVHAPLLAENDAQARHLRDHFNASKLLALNLMGSPGSGKTALIEAVARAVGDRFHLAAVSGDLATTLDADRLAAAGVASAAITTGSACHLDAAMVHRAIHLDPFARAVRACDVLFI